MTRMPLLYILALIGLGWLAAALLLAWGWMRFQQHQQAMDRRDKLWHGRDWGG